MSETAPTTPDRKYRIIKSAKTGAVAFGLAGAAMFGIGCDARENISSESAANSNGKDKNPVAAESGIDQGAGSAEINPEAELESLNKNVEGFAKAVYPALTDRKTNSTGTTHISEIDDPAEGYPSAMIAITQDEQEASNGEATISYEIITSGDDNTAETLSTSTAYTAPEGVALKVDSILSGYENVSLSQEEVEKIETDRTSVESFSIDGLKRGTLKKEEGNEEGPVEFSTSYYGYDGVEQSGNYVNEELEGGHGSDDFDPIPIPEEKVAQKASDITKKAAEHLETA